MANALLTDAAAKPKSYPLGLCQCSTCGLVQNLVNLTTEELFGSDYPYYSGVSQMVRQCADDLARQIAVRTRSGATAIEVGSNDGTTQRALARHNIRCIGIDPAHGPVSAAQDAGCEAYCGVLDDNMSAFVLEKVGMVDVVTMSNVFAHVPDPRALLHQIRGVLQPNGLLVIEVQSWLDLVRSGSFDMVYHEHHCHFSLSSLAWVLGEAGFGIQSFQETPAQGGSLRVFCQMDHTHSPDVRAQLSAEQKQVEAAPAQLQAHFDSFRVSSQAFGQAMAGKSIAGYGAAAKTVTLLASLDEAFALTCIADRAPSKIGKYLPFGGVPIVSPDTMMATQPSAIILFAWNLQAEVLPTLAGHQVWVPLPEFRRVA
ncbi:hypothetical protein AN191_03415 [Loktanella sp. 5RATIMAR09]|nr:hypothetical protein AN191_03415 [Loktanella sp. 5RATIMAR09]